MSPIIEGHKYHINNPNLVTEKNTMNFPDKLFLAEERLINLKESNGENEFKEFIGKHVLLKNDSMSRYLHSKGVKLCIYFPFPFPKNKEDSLNLFPTYLHSMFKYMFIRKFTSLLVQNYSPLDAYHNAKNDVIEELSFKITQEF